MSDKSFMRDNAVLILGILLPVLLVAFIGVANQVAKTTVADPEYALLYTRNTNYSNKGFDVVVENGSLSVYYEHESSKNHYQPSLTIMLYDYKNGTIKDYKFKTPDTQPDDRVKIDIDKPLQEYKIIDSVVSPDGYIFESYYRRSSPFNIFGGGRGRAVISKEGRRIKLPETDRYYYNMKPIGWIKSESIGEANE